MLADMKSSIQSVLILTILAGLALAANVDKKSVKQNSRKINIKTSASMDSSYTIPKNLASILHRNPEIMLELRDPLETAASYPHHKKSTTGWLDMGAWTKKKGAFGWYADYPVGKGKK